MTVWASSAHGMSSKKKYCSLPTRKKLCNFLPLLAVGNIVRFFIPSGWPTMSRARSAMQEKKVGNIVTTQSVASTKTLHVCLTDFFFGCYYEKGWSYSSHMKHLVQCSKNSWLRLLTSVSVTWKESLQSLTLFCQCCWLNGKIWKCGLMPGPMDTSSVLVKKFDHWRTKRRLDGKTLFL